MATVSNGIISNPRQFIRTLMQRRGVANAMLAVVILITFLIRLRLVHLPLERDEGEYAYAGQLILEGIPPWSNGLLYNMKLPGTYLAYAGILATFGQTPTAIHLGLLLTDSLSCVLLWMLVRFLFGKRAALISCVSFCAMIGSVSVLGPMAHATHFVIVWMLLGYVLLCRGIRSSNIAILFLSGLSLGMSLLMKQPGAIYCLFALIVLFISDVHSRWPILYTMCRSVCFCFAVSLPYAVTCYVLYRCGVFKDFWFWTFDYARAYAGEVDLSSGWQRLLMAAATFLSNEGVLLALFLLGFCRALFGARRSWRARAVLGFTCVSAIAVSADLYFRPHYFVMLIPAVAGLIGYHFSNAVSPLRFWTRLQLPLLIGLFLLGIAQPIVQEFRIYFRLPDFEVLQTVYNQIEAEDFIEAVQAGSFIKNHTARDERIFIYGNEPEIFFYSHRHSATGYIYAYPLGEDQALVDQMQQQFSREAVTASTNYALIEPMGVGFVTPQGQRLNQWLSDYLRSSYKLDGVIATNNGAASTFMLPNTAAGRPVSPLLIFRKK